MKRNNRAISSRFGTNKGSKLRNFESNGVGFKVPDQLKQGTKLNPNNPLPNLDKLSVQLGNRSRKDAITKERGSKLQYKKRTSSRRAQEELMYESGNGFYKENITENKHLINNCSPNYIELNKMIRDKLNNPTKGLTDFETKLSDMQGFNRTTRYKIGIKGMLVRHLIN